VYRIPLTVATNPRSPASFHANIWGNSETELKTCGAYKRKKPKKGVEPLTPALRKRCSTIELLRQLSVRRTGPYPAVHWDGAENKHHFPKVCKGREPKPACPYPFTPLPVPPRFPASMHRCRAPHGSGPAKGTASPGWFPQEPYAAESAISGRAVQGLDWWVRIGFRNTSQASWASDFNKRAGGIGWSRRLNITFTRRSCWRLRRQSIQSLVV
jgi:hypothetical protein